jgi:glycosyltransferase involved in cell wall biosynthesis
MRFALLFEFGTLNGGEHSMLAVVDRLRDAIDFVAIAPPGGRLAAALQDRRVEHVPFDVRDAEGTRRPRAELLDRLAAIVGRIAPDVLHANSLSMSRWTGALGDRIAIPRTGHLRDIVKLSAAVVRDLNGNDRLIAVSRATRDFHVGQGLDAARVDVRYNGVDLERFAPRPRTGFLRRELALPDEAVVALSIGQIGLRKGQDVLAEAAIGAFRSLATAGVPFPLHVVLVGERLSSKAESIVFERAIGDRFEATGTGDRLHRLGYRTDVPALLHEADLLVHAAKQEPLGRVLLEAAASGCPIVATNVGGTPEILDATSARLVPPGDAAVLAAAIVDVVAHPTAARDRAAAARATAEERFDVCRTAERLHAFWNDVRR